MRPTRYDITALRRQVLTELSILAHDLGRSNKENPPLSAEYRRLADHMAALQKDTSAANIAAFFGASVANGGEQ
jgi:hypothetical protein